MRAQYDSKLKNLLQEQAAIFFNRESNRLSLITVTGCDISKDHRYANIYISVLPTERAEDALNFAKRKRGELRAFIIKQTKMGNLPHLDVMLVKTF